MTEQEWLRAYVFLILRLDRRLAGTGRGWVVDYFGPDSWRASVAAEELPPIGRLVDDASELATDLPFAAPRRGYLAAHVRALHTLARQESGVRVAMPDLIRDCLGIEVELVPETVFEQAHDELDRALPKSAGSLASGCGTGAARTSCRASGSTSCPTWWHWRSPSAGRARTSGSCRCPKVNGSTASWCPGLVSSESAPIKVVWTPRSC